METAIRVYVILSACGGGFFPSTREDQRTISVNRSTIDS